MTSWQKSSCICCAQNCGLELEIEGNRIVKARADKENPRSQGYVCRKGLKIAHYQHNSSRLTHPLKKTPSGFQRISWDQALDEIAAALRQIVDTHGPRSLAYMGGGGQGCHFEAAFGVRLLRGLGSKYHYSALAQELTGMFWGHGRMFGRQYLMAIPDELQTDMLISVGWNGWMSHQMPQARRHLKRISDDPEKLLVVIDPRKSETAQKADIHLALRPGTDALLFKAMLSIILNEGWQDADYIARHVSGLEQIVPWFKDFDAKAALEVCELDYGQVREFCRLCGTRKWSLHTDLGILMNRHSTVVSYLVGILMAICGRIGVPGGNLFPGYLMPMGAHSDERDKRTWRTMETDFFGIMGTYPPNVMPEEILSNREDRLRAVIVSGANPLRSYADTTAYEQAFEKLELSVTIDVVMSETAVLSQYVLPARSAYEKWDGTFFTWTHPEVYFQMRRPVLEPEGEQREESEIFTGLAERLGLVPSYPESLAQAAQGDRLQFGLQLMQYAASEPRAAAVLPFILARTLGTALGSPNLAALWGLLQTAPKSFREMAARAGFNPGPTMGEEIFQAILDHPEGLWIGKSDLEKNLEAIRTEDGKINVHIPELADWIGEIDAPRERKALALSGEFPLVLAGGRHFDHNANTIMRDPAWNDHKDACTLLIHPTDAAAAGIKDGQRVSVTTEAGREEITAQVTDTCRPGHVVIPHGFGLVYEGKPHGANVNRLAKNTNRDRLAATPLHRFIPCRVEPC
ncbi:MAG: molybdopterin-dependent oxidoreductase [Thermodesulfobacteriota bacterium]